MRHYSIITLSLLVMGTIVLTNTLSGCANKNAGQHPRIYISNDQKKAFAAKVENAGWAKQAYDKIKSTIEPYVDRHLTDPEWIISRLQMYWDTHYERVYVKGDAFSHGTGQAPVPTVKFAGHRDGATDYLMPSLEDTQPYMDKKGMYLQNSKKEGQPWEWVHPSKTGRMIGPMNERILKMAADAAMLYWMTEEEKYAKFASDIFLTYMKGLYYRREPFALENYNNSHLMGLATFEVILDHMIPDLAVCYDFIYDYLKANDTDLDMLATVFKRLADQQIMYGVPDNNWNIFQARHVTYIALALENNDYYKDGKGRQYYLNEILNHTTIRQFALKEMLDESFDPQTALWLESANYSMSVCSDMLNIVSLIDQAENNHALDSFAILKRAVPATVEYLFPNGRVTAFGDARYTPLQAAPFEMLVSLYRKYGNTEGERALTGVLQKLISDGYYNRNDNTSPFALFFYVDSLMSVPQNEVNYTHLQHDFFYTPNTSWLMQRNGRDKSNGAAVTLTGAFGNHAHANGISMEMYGKGYVLAPESSYGQTYTTRDNQEYYARFPAHNTVIVDGISDYGMMRGNAPYTLISSYPRQGENLKDTEQITFAHVSLTEPKTNAKQERLTGTVRIDPTSAYVVDIFRSAREDGMDKKHEYVYHSLAKSVDIWTTYGIKIDMAPTEDLSSALGDQKGYDYFTDKRASVFSDNFEAHFSMGLPEAQDVRTKLWMKGFTGRTIYKVNAPKSNAQISGSVPDALLGKPLPTVIVKQRGEAWYRPFVAIIHPYTATEGPAIKSITTAINTGDLIALVVQSTSRTDFIFQCASGKQVGRHLDMTFNGIYGVVSEANGNMQHLFLGEGKSISKGNWLIETTNTDSSASITHTDEGYEVVVHGQIRLKAPMKDGRTPNIISYTSPGKNIAVDTQEANKVSVSLSEGMYRITYK